MRESQESVFVSEKSGRVSALITAPNHPRAVLALAHGAGTDMRHAFMAKMADSLAERGIAVVRYNFPYTENGRKMPDRFPVAAATVRAVTGFAAEAFDTLPLFAGGKSFGGRMTSQAEAEAPMASLRGIVFLGFPLHRPGEPSAERAVHLKQVAIPLLFLQGTKDEMATPDLLHEVCRSLPLATLVEIEGADHSFARGSATLIRRLADETAQWITTMTTGKGS